MCIFSFNFSRSQRIRHKWIDDKKKKNLTKIFNLSLRYDDPLSLSTVIGRGNPTIVIPFYARWSNCDRGVERQQSSDVHQRATSRSRLTRDVPIPLDRRVSQLGQLGRRKWPRIQFVCADNETIIRINGTRNIGIIRGQVFNRGWSNPRSSW